MNRVSALAELGEHVTNQRLGTVKLAKIGQDVGHHNSDPEARNGMLCSSQVALERRERRGKITARCERVRKRLYGGRVNRRVRPTQVIKLFEQPDRGSCLAPCERQLRQAEQRAPPYRRLLMACQDLAVRLVGRLRITETLRELRVDEDVLTRARWIGRASCRERVYGLV